MGSGRGPPRRGIRSVVGDGVSALGSHSRERLGTGKDGGRSPGIETGPEPDGKNSTSSHRTAERGQRAHTAAPIAAPGREKARPRPTTASEPYSVPAPTTAPTPPVARAPTRRWRARLGDLATSRWTWSRRTCARGIRRDSPRRSERGERQRCSGVNCWTMPSPPQSVVTIRTRSPGASWAWTEAGRPTAPATATTTRRVTRRMEILPYDARDTGDHSHFPQDGGMARTFASASCLVPGPRLPPGCAPPLRGPRLQHLLLQAPVARLHPVRHPRG